MGGHLHGIIIIMPLDHPVEGDLGHGRGHLFRVLIDMFGICLGDVEAKDIVDGTWTRLGHVW